MCCVALQAEEYKKVLEKRITALEGLRQKQEGGSA